MKRSFFITLLMAIFILPVMAQKQSFEQFKATRKITLNYLAWLPEAYKTNKNQTFPLLIFLHGSGERGNDLNLVKKWGPPSFVENKSDFPFITISPQCPEGQWWNIEDLQALYLKLLKKYRIDKARVYLTGLSMGGFGTWAWAIQYPKQFAAIVPVCGGSDPIFADEIKDVPVWAFHGEDDPVVPVQKTKEMVEALKKNGGNPKMTLYPGVGHDSWIKAYNDPELYKWFLSNTLKK